MVLLATAFVRFDVEWFRLSVEPRFSFSDFSAELPRHLLWLLPFCVLTAVTVPLRALQWQTTLRGPTSFSLRYHLVALAGIANNVLPGKVGDLLRAFLLARSEKLPFVESLGSVAVCKLFELVALAFLLFFCLISPFGGALEPFRAAWVPAAAGCGGLLCLGLALAFGSKPLADFLARQNRFPRAVKFLVEMHAGLASARSLRGMLRVLVYSLGPVLAPALAYGWALEGLGVPGGIFAGAVVLAALSIGQTAAAPAATGAYCFVAAWAARALGCSEQHAAAFATLTYLGTAGTQLLLGLLSVKAMKLSWADLRAKGSSARVSLEAAQAQPEASVPVTSSP